MIRHVYKPARPPKHLYRYFDRKGAWLCLNDSTLRFSPPICFDDPFDTNIGIDYKPCDSDLREFYVKMVKEQGRGCTSPSEDQFVQQYLDDLDWGDNILSKAKDNFMQRTLGVACFTELQNDPLMWALYAEKHRGVVIGFDTSHLSPEPETTRRVKYSNTRPVHQTLCGKLNGKELEKSDIWKWQKEWRLSAQLDKCQKKKIGKDTFYVQTLSRASFASATFGCRTPRKFKLEIASRLKGWNLEACKLREMELCSLTYKLKSKRFAI
jgi:hypothetical protein